MNESCSTRIVGTNGDCKVYYCPDVLRALYHLPAAHDDCHPQVRTYDILVVDYYMLGGNYDCES